MRIYVVLASLVLPLAVFGMARAQERVAELPPASSAVELTSAGPNAAVVPSASASLSPPPTVASAPLPSAVIGSDSQRARIDSLEKSVARLTEQLEQERAESAETSEATSTRKLEVYGFFDVTHQKITHVKRLRALTIDGKPVVKNVSFWDGLMPSHGQFLLTNLNLYFASQLTHTLSSLVELRFTYQPLGEETGYSYAGMTQYERTNTAVRDNIAGQPFTLGGLSIVRAQARWQPYDAFGIMAGRFLTPFGIWNVDHGTPILPTVRYPSLLTTQIIPAAQSGVQALGRFFVYDSGYIDYAVSASNGRTPTDGWSVLNGGYGAGLRLKFTHDSPDFSTSLGAYGYAGVYKDVSKAIESVAPFHVRTDETIGYDERAYALDAQVKFWGIWLQSELAQRVVKYTTRPGREYGGGVRSSTEFEANSVTSAVYGFLGYELPLSRWLGTMRLMPYFMIERMVDNDTTYFKGTGYYGGLNFKPVPSIAIKAEGFAYLHENDETQPMPMNFWGMATQLAVAF